MTIEPVLALLSALALLFAVAALFQKNLYGSAVCLLAVLLQIAAVFFVQGDCWACSRSWSTPGPSWCSWSSR